MKSNEIVNRTQVYRAVYYSGFDFERDTENRDIYILKSRTSQKTIKLYHSAQGNFSDQISIILEPDIPQEDMNRLERLINKINKRCNKMNIMRI